MPPAKHEQQRHPDQHGVNHVVAQQARHHARKHAHCHAARTKAARLHIFQRVGDEHREERRKQHVLGKIAGEHRMIRAEGEKRRRNPRRSARTGAGNRRADQRKADRYQRHLNRAAQQRALFKGLQQAVCVQTEFEQQRMRQRIEHAVTVLGDLEGLRGHVIGERTGKFDEQHRRIAREKQQRRAPCAEGFLAFARPAHQFRHRDGQQRRQHDKGDRKRGGKPRKRPAPCRRAELLDLAAQRRQQRIAKRAKQQHGQLSAPVFAKQVLYFLHAITQ